MNGIEINRAIKSNPNSPYSNLLTSIRLSQKKGLGRRMLIAVLLMSSLFTVVQASYQLYTDYKLGLSEIEQQFQQIYLSYNKSLSSSIWDIDTEETDIIGAGMLSLPNVESVVITAITESERSTLLALKTSINENLTTKVFDLSFINDGEGLLIGELEVSISLDPLYDDLLDRLLLILIFQTLKTFSVSIFIFAIFYYLVAQHLTSMAKFSESLDSNEQYTPLILNRKQPRHSDELDEMVKALNKAKTNLKKMFEYNQKSNELEKELDLQQQKEQIYTQHHALIEKKNNELNDIINTLNDTQEKLINSEKMALLGNMVTGVAHELNTPIGVSITGVSHIEKQTQKILKLFNNSQMKKSDLLEYFSEIESLSHSINVSLDKSAELIQSFKLVSAEQHQDVVCNFNLHKNFEDIVNSLRPSFSSKNIEIRNSVEQYINFRSYPGILYQIFTNLINNANLHAFEDQQSGLIELRTEISVNSVVIIFTDNGKGMPKNVINRLFDPFFTTRRGKGGTGLGMSIVNTLVTDKLNGKIEVGSELNRGTSFRIILPIAVIAH